MIETGTVLQNRYRIDKQIGQGGMGKVYVATDERFKSVVAIKETVFEDINLRKAFEREARLLNSLKHTALPRVSDHFDENDGQFLVMEFIAGEDLAERMEKNGEAFPLETVLDWANQLCAALEYLHAQDIIHRDIKPQNLKLTPNNQIVLLDFGLAKGNATDAPHQTAAKSIFGFSRSYASLEQIQGAGTEPRSDLYSLGATVYHLLTGIPPADALTRAMNVLNKQSDPLIPANLINREVPKGVAEVLLKAMALNANERPESASGMRSMLDESDKFVDLNASESAIEKSLTADFLTQETKIIGAKTNVTDTAPSEVETKIAPVKKSENSQYQTKITDNQPESKRTVVQQFAAPKKSKLTKAAATAIVLGGLFFIGVGLLFAYFLKPNTSQSNISAENANMTVVNAISANNNFNGNLSEANIVLAEDNTANKSTTEIPARSIETTKSDTKKQASNSSSAIRQKNNNADSDGIIINDENDSIEMNGVIIDDNGIRDKKTGKSLIPIPPKPNEPPTQPNYMSPEQTLKLEQLRERLKNNKKRIVVIKTPTPEK